MYIMTYCPLFAVVHLGPLVTFMRKQSKDVWIDEVRISLNQSDKQL